MEFLFGLLGLIAGIVLAGVFAMKRFVSYALSALAGIFFISGIGILSTERID